jgi:hypothetical protein
MNADNKEDLFGLRLDATGIRYMLKFSKICFSVGILITIALTLSAIISVKRIYDLFSNHLPDTLLELKYKIIFIVSFILDIVNFIAVWYYVKFSREIKKSIVENNEVLFNRAFKYLVWNITVYVVTLSLGIILGIEFCLEILHII